MSDQFEVLTESAAIEAVKGAHEIIFDFYWDGHYNAELGKLVEWGSTHWEDGEEFDYIMVEFEKDCNCRRDCCSGIARKKIDVPLTSISIVINEDGDWAELPTYSAAAFFMGNSPAVRRWAR